MNSDPCRRVAALAMLLLSLGAAPFTAAEPGIGIPLNLTRGEVRRVASVPELRTVLDSANERKTATTLLLADGTYRLDGLALDIRCPGLVVRSASGNREAVILRGPDEGPAASTSTKASTGSYGTTSSATSAFLPARRASPSTRSISGSAARPVPRTSSCSATIS